MEPTKERLVQVAWPSYLAMLDLFNASIRPIIDDLQRFTFELQLELAMEQYQRSGDVSGLLALWIKQQFVPIIIGPN